MRKAPVGAHELSHVTATLAGRIVGCRTSEWRLRWTFDSLPKPGLACDDLRVADEVMRQGGEGFELERSKENTGRTAGALISLARNGLAGASLSASNPDYPGIRSGVTADVVGQRRCQTGHMFGETRVGEGVK